ncbi:hypothetical protein SNE40_000473 [Patella caerulea]|uniref:Uncharacterized protein n=1 Tax=Patella caerulea TaxID=87958 RepID=A0AAN8KDX9_PATCE
MTSLWVIIYFAIAVFCSDSVEADPFGFRVDVDNNGTYIIANSDRIILEGAPPFFIVDGTRYSAADGSLKLINVTDNQSGIGPLGVWTSRDIYYMAGTTVIIASARNYPYQYVTFSVKYIAGASNTQASDFEQIICGFPGFKIGTPRTDLGYLAFGGHFAGDTDKSMGKFDSTATIHDGLEGSGPLVIFDKTRKTTVITPLDRFMVTSMWHDKTNNYIYWGLMGGLDNIPYNFEYQTIVYQGEGINAVLSEWGMVLRDLYYNHTKSYFSADKDISTKYLGYSTGDGTYYSKASELGKNYADTIIALQHEAVTETKLPFKYFQLNSWWCIKNGSKIKDWKADPTALPQGMAGLENATDLKFMMYSGKWSSDNVYAQQNGGMYGFVIEKEIALPLDQKFWDDLFQNAAKWGLTTYEQDAMAETFMDLNVTKVDLTVSKTWLQQMNDAAVRNNISILYSDTYPRHIYQTLMLPAVTQARVSQNYGKNTDQWKIGISSIFVDAVSLIPNKDSLRTNLNNSGLLEPYPELELIVALLSRGPVGVGDRLKFVNSTILKMCCSTDGKLLQPMNPAKAIDSQIMQAAFQDGSGPDGEVWSTFTSVSAVGMINAKYGIIFSAGLSKPFDVTPENLYLDYQFPNSKIYSRKHPSQLFDFKMGTNFTLENCTLEDFCLYYTAPIIEFDGQEVVILGELDKWIHMPYQRVKQITVTDTIEMEINGAPNEQIEIWIAVNGNIGALATRANDSGVAFFKYERKHTPTNGATHVCSVVTTLIYCFVVALSF